MGSLPNRTEHRKRRFLAEFEQTGIISHAAEAAGVGRTTVYEWQEHDEHFALAFQQAEIRATEVLESEARRRAVDGVERQRRVYDSRGNLIDEYIETTYSDTLLIFLLKARAPEKYRERHDITSGGEPIRIANQELDTVIAERLAELAIRGEGQDAMAAAGTSEPIDA